MLENSRVSAQLAAFQEGLNFMSEGERVPQKFHQNSLFVCCPGRLYAMRYVYSKKEGRLLGYGAV
jgi:hypothetical protein